MLSYFGKNIPILYDVDCCIVGGGTSGVAAAISAIDEGLKTVVIEKGIKLGGTQTRALVSPFMQTKVNINSTTEKIINRLMEEGDSPFVQGVKNGDGVWFNAEILSYVQEKLILENGGNILYDVTFVDAVVNHKHIEYIILSTIQGLVAIKSKNFIDASGDAILSRAAGVAVKKGDDDGKNQSMSLRFEMGGIDLHKLYNYMQSKGDRFCASKPPYYEIAMVMGKGFVLEEDFKKGLEKGLITKEDITYFQAFTVPSKQGVMTFNCPEVVVTRCSTETKEITKAIIAARGSVRRICKFLKCFIPGFENSYLSKEAEAVGIRESFRIIGKYVCNENDYINRRKFGNGVVKGDWYIDIHGKDMEEKEKSKYKDGEYYEIPYTSFVTNEIDNLIVIGRCISANFLMQSSIRIQYTCYEMGHMAGKACKYSINNKIELNDIDGAKLKNI